MEGRENEDRSRYATVKEMHGYSEREKEREGGSMWKTARKMQEQGILTRNGDQNINGMLE